MFDKAKLSPDNAMYSYVDDVNEAIRDVRSLVVDAGGPGRDRTSDLHFRKLFRPSIYQ